MPEGFFYKPDFISLEEESNLLNQIASLNFQPFDFHGYTAKRRIVEYGYEYDFTSRQAQTAPPLPTFLEPLRVRAAHWAGVPSDEIIESVITEYSPGSPIGWHRDVPQFEIIMGISLKSSCRFRFKPYRREGKFGLGFSAQHPRGENASLLHHVPHLEIPTDKAQQRETDERQFGHLCEQ